MSIPISRLVYVIIVLAAAIGIVLYLYHHHAQSIEIMEYSLALASLGKDISNAKPIHYPRNLPEAISENVDVQLNIILNADDVITYRYKTSVLVIPYLAHLEFTTLQMKFR